MRYTHMKMRLTPYYLELVQDCCLKSFWRKRSLSAFLRRSGVAASFLGGWAADESKRDLLDRLFPKLLETDAGRAAILRIAQNLMEQRTFPDLANWENSTQMIKDAHDAVGRLRIYHAKQEEELQSERDRDRVREEFRQRQEAVRLSQATLQALSDRLNQLAFHVGEQQAGYDFQTWFYDFLDFCEIQNRRPYVHEGRQIDGALTLSGTTYLVELKFTKEQAAAADIDSLYSKVVHKADNTMGIMVSISGYSAVARREASSDRTPLLLLDHSHLFLALTGTMSMADVIERVRRHASQTGEAYLEVSAFHG